MRTSIKCGLGLTFIYCLFIAYFYFKEGNSFISFSFQEILNNISNITTPLILIWAIIGYTIQANDSKKTLNYLSDEKNRIELSSIARFHFHNFYLEDDIEFGALKISLTLKNYGKEAKNIHIKILPKNNDTIKTKVYLLLEKSKKIQFDFYPKEEVKGNFDLRIRYIDTLGRKHEQLYSCEPSDYLLEYPDIRTVSPRLIEEKEISNGN